MQQLASVQLPAPLHGRLMSSVVATVPFLMAVEINPAGGFGESVSLHGADAARFLDEVLNPSTDERRLAFLKRSDEAFERLFSSEPISELPTE